MLYKEARIKKKHDKYVPMPAQLRRACHKYVPTTVIGLNGRNSLYCFYMDNYSTNFTYMVIK